MNQLMILGMIALISSGCCQNPVVTKPVPLPFPVERMKPRIDVNEVSCLSRPTMQKLIIRDATWEAELTECRAIIGSTHHADTN